MKTQLFRQSTFFLFIILLFLLYSCEQSDNSPKEEQLDEEIQFSGTYTFTSTNFEDGWTSTAKEDWVEVTKGVMKVLLHYPKEGTIIQADPEPFINNAWDILVAPRYTTIKNYQIAQSIPDYERAYFSSANLTDPTTGKEIYVAFFRKANSGWIEFVSPDKNTFVDFFGIDISTISWESDLNIYDPLFRMSGYNMFAVAAADLPGKWSSDFASNTYYTNIYTGYSAGMSTYTSNITYVFGSESYSWDLVAANSSGGQTDFAQASATGKYSVINNWQITCSDIEGKPVTYNAFFSCIKGARFLWLQDVDYGGYSSFGRIE